MTFHKKRAAFAVACVLALLGGLLVGRVKAQTSTFAFCYFDPGEMGGPLQATGAGWRWVLACAYRSPAARTIVSGISVDTLEGDTLGQTGIKLANGVKADMIARGFPSPVSVLLPTFSTVIPQ